MDTRTEPEQQVAEAEQRLGFSGDRYSYVDRTGGGAVSAPTPQYINWLAERIAALEDVVSELRADRLHAGGAAQP